MSSTSKILVPEEHASVSPIWWRDSRQAPVNESREEPVKEQPEEPPIPQFGQAQTPPSMAAHSAQFDESDRERIEREAYQRGFAEGKNLGKEQASAELQPVLERLTRCLAELAALRPRMRREAEKDLVTLAIAIARRVLHRELTLDPQSIEVLIKVALDRLESRELCTVRIHPDQEAIIRKLLERFSSAHKIEIITDKALQAGDVLLETQHGSIDASVDAQLNEIERGFADRLRR